MKSRKPFHACLKHKTSPLGYRRADEHLFANAQEFRAKSYRARRIASRSSDIFETWLKEKLGMAVLTPPFRE